jgi:multiple sugar transport system substrate-binding protein
MSKAKRWSAAALAAAVAVAIAGCGDDGGGGTPDPTGEVDLQGVELQVMGWSSSSAEDEALTGLLEQFNQETGAQATFNPVPEYDTTLQAALSGGTPPDVFYVDSYKLPDLADAGVLAPVPDGVLTDPDGIYPSLREAFTYDGVWYCPPKDFSTLALVYDPDAFAEAGLEPPTTWEELRAAAEALTTDDRAGLVMGVEYPRWGVFLHQAGGALTNPDVTEVTIDSSESRTGLEFITELYAEGLAVSPSQVDAGWAGEAFGKGRAAMAIEGNWVVNALNQEFPDRNWAVAELPAGPAGKATFAFTVCYGVAANAKNPAASWALVDYLTSPEGSLAWTQDFAVMPAHESARDAWLDKWPHLEAFLAGADYAHKWQFRPGFADVVGVFDENAQAIVGGNGTVDKLIDATASAGGDVLG